MKFPIFFYKHIGNLRWFFIPGFIFCLSPASLAQDYEADTTVKKIIIDEAGTDDEEEVMQESPFTYRWEQDRGGGPDTKDMRKVSPSALNKLQSDKSFWYADVAPDSSQRQKPEQKKEQVPEPEKEKPRSSNRESFLSDGVVRAFLWLLTIVGFGALVIWYLTNSNVMLFRRNRKVGSIGNDEPEEMPEDLFKISYQRELERAIAAGNYRLGVRLLYLRLLKQLSDKGKIRYRQESTNADYLAQLYGTPLYSDFFRVTRHYEYSWYGQFPVTEPIFHTIRNEAEKLEVKI